MAGYATDSPKLVKKKLCLTWTAGLPGGGGGAGFPWTAGWQDFMEQRTSLNRTSLNGRTSLDGRPLLEDMVERSLLAYAEMYSSLCV